MPPCLKVVLIDQLIEYFNLPTFPPQVAQRPRLPLRQLAAVLRRVVSALKQGQGGHLLQRSPGEKPDLIFVIFSPQRFSPHRFFSTQI